MCSLNGSFFTSNRCTTNAYCLALCTRLTLIDCVCLIKIKICKLKIWYVMFSWLSCMWCFLAFCHFPMWCPGSSVVLDCIDSWSLPSYLLLLLQLLKQRLHYNKLTQYGDVMASLTYAGILWSTLAQRFDVDFSLLKNV